jgi:hypothetical protein
MENANQIKKIMNLNTVELQMKYALIVVILISWEKIQNALYQKIVLIQN